MIMNGVSRSLVRILVIITREKELSPLEETIAAWVLVLGLVPLVLRVSVRLLIISGVTNHSPFIEDVFFYSRVIIGCGLLGFGLTLAVRQANRFVIRMCLLLATLLLIGPLLEVLTVILGLPSTQQF